MPQQIEVRAVHEVAAAAAETNGAAAQFVGLPSTSRRNGAWTEQDFGDLAVRAAFKPAVEAAEHQSEPAALLRGQGVRRARRGAARQGVEQAACASARAGKLSSSGMTTATRRAVSMPPPSAIGSASRPRSRSQCSPFAVRRESGSVTC